VQSDVAAEDRTLPAQAARLKRLRWRCRRGTRELDALLQGWLDAHAESLDATGLGAFDSLLDQQDPELWDWLMGHAEPPRADWAAIVGEIRARAGLA
jgi:antitoxin CptB